jgi:hypothetical protein
MAMSTDCQENPRHCEEGEHLLSRLWACIFPSLNASVDTFSQVIELRDIEPGNILTIKIRLRKIFFRGYRQI